MTKKAILIPVEGEEQELTPKDGKYFSLEEMQKIVGGYIEIVGLGEGLVLVCNEEGKIDGKSLPNARATKVWQKHYGATDVIYGDVLVCDYSFIE